MTIKCAACGHFIAYDDIHSGRADQSYVPDREFSRETLEFVCPTCFAKDQADITVPEGRRERDR